MQHSLVLTDPLPTHLPTGVVLSLPTASSTAFATGLGRGSVFAGLLPDLQRGSVFSAGLLPKVAGAHTYCVHWAAPSPVLYSLDHLPEFLSCSWDFLWLFCFAFRISLLSLTDSLFVPLHFFILIKLISTVICFSLPGWRNPNRAIKSSCRNPPQPSQLCNMIWDHLVCCTALNPAATLQPFAWNKSATLHHEHQSMSPVTISTVFTITTCRCY